MKMNLSETKLSVPDSLHTLLEGVTRVVIKYKPVVSDSPRSVPDLQFKLNFQSLNLKMVTGFAIFYTVLSHQLQIL